MALSVQILLPDLGLGLETQALLKHELTSQYIFLLYLFTGVLLIFSGQAYWAE